MKSAQDYYYDLHAVTGGFKNRAMIQRHLARVIQEAIQQTRSDSLSAAAEIADNHNGCVDRECLANSNCGATIANQVRALRDT